MNKRSLVLCAVVSVWLANSAQALFSMPEFVPADRLITNTTAYLAEHPTDPEAYYTLARIHYLAFVSRSGLVGTMRSTGRLTNGPPKIAPDWLLGDTKFAARSGHVVELVLEEMGETSMHGWSREKNSIFQEKYYKKLQELRDTDWKLTEPNRRTALNHAKSALLNFNKALEYQPTNGLYHLGLASLCRQFDDYRKEEPITNEPDELKILDLTLARKEFLKAFQCSRDEDMKHTRRPFEGLQSLVAYEAANAFVDLADAAADLTEAEKSALVDARKAGGYFRALPPPRAVTPILFSLAPTAALSELLKQSNTIAFDLDGDDRQELWPWVRPDTAILVWDPRSTGKITSGRQLFGSVTWWIFFENGYCALDALDDNRDGYLTAQELKGIAAWFDRNSDGRSDAGEVVPIESLGVRSLGTRPTGFSDGSPMHAGGVILKNETVLPTYDWIVSPIPPRLRLQ